MSHISSSSFVSSISRTEPLRISGQAHVAPQVLAQHAFASKTPYAAPQSSPGLADRLRQYVDRGTTDDTPGGAPQKTVSGAATGARSGSTPFRRTPDYVSASVSIPVGGPFVSVGVQVTIDKYRQLFVGAGISLGVSAGTPLGVTAGWINGSQAPGKNTLSRVLGGKSANVHLGAGAGGAHSLINNTSHVTLASGAAAGMELGYSVQLPLFDQRNSG
jgi:hypothetical protein